MPETKPEQGKKTVKVVIEDGQARMLSPAGTPVGVAPDEVGAALRQGYTIETPEAIQQRLIRQDEAKEEGQYYTAAAVIGGVVGLIALAKFLKFLGMKGSLYLGGGLLLAVAFFGAFGFFGQLFAGGLVLVLIAAKLRAPRTVVVVEQQARRRSAEVDDPEDD